MCFLAFVPFRFIYKFISQFYTPIHSVPISLFCSRIKTTVHYFLGLPCSSYLGNWFITGSWIHSPVCHRYRTLPLHCTKTCILDDTCTAEEFSPISLLSFVTNRHYRLHHAWICTLPLFISLHFYQESFTVSYLLLNGRNFTLSSELPLHHGTYGYEQTFLRSSITQNLLSRCVQIYLWRI